VPLALAEQRVEHGARVVDGDDAVDDGLARLDVDLDDGDVRAEREARGAGVEGGLDLERLLLGQLREGDPAVGAAHAHAPVGDLQVLDAGLQQLGRALLGQVRELAGRLVDGDAAGLQAARAHRAGAARDEVGVAVLDGDLLDPDAEVLAGEHRPRRRVALAVRGGAGEHGDGAVGVHLHGRVLAERAAAGDLDEHRDADAELHGVAPLAARGLLGAQGRVVGGVEDLVQRRRVVAGVVGGPARRLYGNASEGTRLRRRTSTGSMPISAANRSIARSIAAVASGRPAPR
jgi:hypothetical protein